MNRFVRLMAARSAGKRGMLLACSSVALWASLTGPTRAQWFDEPGGPFSYNRPPPLYRDIRPLRPGAIVDRLESQGYEIVGRPEFDGAVYRVDATSLTGSRVRLLVDPVRGNVIDRVTLSRGSREREFGPPPTWRDAELGERRSRGGRADGDEFRSMFGMGPSQDRDLRPRSSAPVREPSPSREAAVAPRDVLPTRPVRPEAAAPRIEPPAVSPSRVEGTNPDTGREKPRAAPPRATAPDRTEPTEAVRRDALRTEPASRSRPARSPSAAAARREDPAEQVPSSGPAPSAATVASASNSPPPASGGAPPAEPRSSEPRSDKPVRVIGGVTPMNPNAP